MCFDLVVLILTTVKLVFPGGRRSALMKMLFRDGLIYFVIAYVLSRPGGDTEQATDGRSFSFVANLIATVFMLLNLNAIMSVIFNIPAAIASTVRLLSDSYGPRLTQGVQPDTVDRRLPCGSQALQMDQHRSRAVVRPTLPRLGIPVTHMHAALADLTTLLAAWPSPLTWVRSSQTKAFPRCRCRQRRPMVCTSR